MKGLEPEKIKHEAWQIVGWFQEYMEHGAFCLPGERVGLNETGRAPLHAYGIGKRDLQAVDNTFKKALKGVHDLTNDVGAWEEFQRRLWEIADADDKKSTRQDLWVLNALSGLEMISKIIEDMYHEGTLFKRGNWIMQKTRRVIITRLAFLYEWSNDHHQDPDTLLALKKYIKTMTKMDDWGAGRETSGDIFIQFVKDVFKALGLTDSSEEAEISGTTIRSDIRDAGMHPPRWTKYVRVVGRSQSPRQWEEGSCHEAAKKVQRRTQTPGYRRTA
jgi:hypothetical protein